MGSRPAARRPPRAAGRDAGLSIGLYRDLAVGADPNGAEAWADQELIAPLASIGAPPDALSRAGQNWGLAPINPLVLRRQAFAPFIACAARQYAPCRDPADRPRHVAEPALLDPERDGGDGRLLMSTIRSTTFCGWSRSKAAAKAAPWSARISARCRRVFARRMRAAEILSYRVAIFERRPGRRLCAARGIPAARRRLGGHPRPRHPRRLLARPRHRLAPSSRPLSRSAGGGSRSGGAAPRPPPAARSAGRRRAARRRAVRRVPAGDRRAGLFARARRCDPSLISPGRARA